MADIRSTMEINRSVPICDHLIEVERLGYVFSVTHTYRGKLLFTASYEKEMDALRSAAIVGTSVESRGNEVCLNIKTHIRELV